MRGHNAELRMVLMRRTGWMVCRIDTDTPETHAVVLFVDILEQYVGACIVLDTERAVAVLRSRGPWNLPI